MKKRLLLSILMAIALVFSVGGGVVVADDDDDDERSEDAEEYAGDRILVKFKDSTSDDEKEEAHKRRGGKVEDVIPELNVHVVSVAKGEARNKSKEYDEEEDDVEFVEVDYVVRAIFTPNDSYFGNQWALPRIQAEQAWDITRGSSTVKVAILDTGIDRNHADLASKVVAVKNFSTSGTTDDRYGHGTHVAGIAAAITNNASGVAGVGFNSTLMNVKVLGDSGTGYHSRTAKGIIWAADNGAKVINLSLGGTSSSSTLENAINYAWNKGVVVVAAAGNSNTSAPLYPAYYSNAIAVAATDNNDTRASYSNYGSWVDVAAPGSSIYSTMPNHTNRLGKKDYGTLSGTSMATPHVAGLAALMFGFNQQATNSQVREKIQSTVDAAIGFDTAIGRINAFKAVS